MKLNSDHFSRLVIASLILTCLVLAIYIQTVHFQFTNYDDDIYVSRNPYVAAGLTKESVRWAFEADLLYPSPGVDYWQPLSALSRMLDIQLFGMDPGAHHFVNVLFHAANTVLLFIILAAATSAFWPSFFAACLFAAHPLQVDTVAWVTARKDLLATFLGLWSFWFYHKFATGKKTALWLSVIFFALSLMAKPALAALPALFLIFDVWLYGRLNLQSLRGADQNDAEAISVHGLLRRFTPRNDGFKLILEKWPFFALVALSFLTLVRGHSTAVASAFFYLTAIKIPIFYMRYLYHFLYPIDLLVRYPEINQTIWMAADSIVVFAGITYFAARAYRKFPYILAGWLWFLVILTPSVGLDFENRYMHIALVGLLIIIVWGLADVFRRLKVRQAIWALAMSALVAGLSVLSWISTSHWKSSLTLFQSIVTATPQNPRALNNLATAYAEEGQFQPAIDAYTKAIWQWPDFSEAHNNLGVCLMRVGNNKIAYTHLRTALDIKPDYDKALNNMAILMRRMGDVEGSIHYARRAVQMSPQLLEARFNLGVSLVNAGQFDEAIRQLEYLLNVNPRDSEALSAMGFAYYRKGDYETAEKYFLESIRINPNFEEAYNNLGNVYAQMGRVNEAIGTYQHAIALVPGYPEAHNNIAVLLAGLGRKDEAVSHFNQALHASPDYETARLNLRLALSKEK